ncbi:hypothetical protein HGRIS_005150 [Hohenbuehelia grisea]|uniref:Uncharacterized protein n=1 Tax=Hohenbuehelia grisea TaxID=104357 RepID=A0ABR3JEM6_9AGAR
MAIHQQNYKQRRALHDRFVARQLSTDLDIPRPTESAPPPADPPTPSSTPPVSRNTPTPSPPPRANDGNQASRSPSSTPRVTPTPTPTSKAEDTVVESTPSTTSTSSLASETSLSSSSSSSSLSLTTTNTQLAVRPTETIIVTSSFRTISQSRFVNTATLSSAEPTSTATATGGLSSGAIVGAVGGGICGVAILIFLAMFIIRNIRKRSYSDDHFDSATFRRSAIMLNDDNPLARHTDSSFKAARPPTMIERQLAAHPVAPSPVPQAYGNYHDDYDYGAPPQPQQSAYEAGYAGTGAYNTYGAQDQGYGNYNGTYGQAYSDAPPTASAGSAAVPATRVARANPTAPRDSRVISRVDDADVYGGI